MKKALCLFLCLVVAVGLLPARTYADEVIFDRYGYERLDNTSQRYVYETLVPCIAEHREMVELDIEKQVTQEDAETALQMIIRDYPEYFWFSQERFAFMATEDNWLMSIQPVYTLNEAEISYADPRLNQAIDVFQSKVEAMVSAIPSTMTTHYEIALYLHDALAAAVTYRDTNNDQNAYGALVEGEAVCAGYARAYQCLLAAAGIDSWFVTGESYDASGVLLAHAWNLVWIFDDLSSSYRCLYTDVTWDDQKDSLFHMYFNCGGEEFMDSHFPDDFSSVYLPACDHDGHDYFSKTHGAGTGVYDNLTDATTAAQAANNFSPMTVKDGVGTRTLDIYFSGVDFDGWLRGNIDALGVKLGFSGRVSYSYSVLGAEYRLSISGTPAVPPVEAVSVTLDKTRIDFTQQGQTYTLQATISPADTTDKTVTFTSQDPSVASVDPRTGVVTAVRSGTTNITVTTANGKAASCLIQVTIAAPAAASIAVEGGTAYFEDGNVAEKAVAGTLITIRADEAPAGMEFDHWSITIGAGVVLADSGKAETTFYMPEQGAVLLKTNYRKETVHVTGVTLDAEQIDLPAVGSTAVLTATVQPAEATNQEVVWISKDPQIVTVRGGQLVAVVAGTTEITATTQDGGFVARCVVTVAVHSHDETLQAIQRQEPTCTQNGYGAHYVCASCGLWFEDELGQIPIVDHSTILLKATGHTPSQWHSDEDQHWKECTSQGCGVKIENSWQPHSDADQDGKCDSCGAQLAMKGTELTDPTEPSSPTQPSDPQPTEPSADTVPPNESSSGWIIWLAVSLVLAAGSVGAWYFLKKRKQ